MSAFRFIFRIFIISVLALAPCLFGISSAHAQTDEDILREAALSPPGANLPDCKPSEEHPYPVILVPGTFESMAFNWSKLSPLLAKKGYCVYALNYGITHLGFSTGPIEKSAEELKAFVDQVLEQTGAEKVSIVGHSQGGMMPRYYIKYLGGAEKVEDLIGLAPSNHGTIGVLGIEPIMILPGLLGCTACDQQKAGSDFLNDLNAGDETPGDVSYTVISTKYDEIVVPYTSAFLDGPEEQVSNITIQDQVPADLAAHLGIAFDSHAYEFVYDALEHDGPANFARAEQKWLQKNGN
ncbi:alpha/beta fold hydrolase [Thermoactinomyces vulgaris]|jgi:triacylglycerol lipase|uniref:Alpha/beta fold hydrolase n=1 Tax=Thermoactinomyces vulgaris TaxID=2026 RepID=A0ABS0QIW7_THEVU|nr:alpha/beta fold hydrolase [Thermoactinomyces vulgaris]MBA4552233.1 alpha/beta fold hydrolase [Thermoactinomyces vulgaris]MBA4597559.1 alpha/beta fold hydrolase [Thermoactinomyces vulgaris]MBH8589177.1 alpha/beta fold hydrolase [Thermoactinomyces vulgaris]RMB00212.1 triacylglycerol esterase/lipase EstA (alpha/beta hydrolase family) [Thermoactinomyces vulgaris]